MSDVSFLVFGAKGWIGGLVCDELKKQARPRRRVVPASVAAGSTVVSGGRECRTVAVETAAGL